MTRERCKKLLPILQAYAEGKEIQWNDNGEWKTVDEILASGCEYRIKPEEKKLRWTDLKVGDVIRNGVFTHLVTGIDNFEQTNKHIFVSGDWFDDKELAEWEKVEE